MLTRSELLQRLRGVATTEILIIGGGINAVGVYRDLAAQGIAALLVEKGDFCSGTSAAPSRLIHGGLRYLETGEFALVRESVEERNLLLKNAPHYVTPLPVWVPVTNWLGGILTAGARFLRLIRVPGPRGGLVLKIGLSVYDWFGAKYRSMPQHRMIGGAVAKRQMPGLAQDICAVGEFYDARLSNAERLTLELIADAEVDCPAAMAIPYLAVIGHEQGQVLLRDEIAGVLHRISPKLIINAAGAWIDHVDKDLGISGQLVGGTKGSHLVLDHPQLAAALGDRMIYFPTADHRICLAYPLADNLVLIGTTDLPTSNPEDMTCSEAEIDYLFQVMRQIMPDLPIERSQIVFRYAGVRPLPKATGNTVAGAISRDHQIRHFPPGPDRPYDVLTLIGGKWTTYRACAAQIVDQILDLFAQSRQKETKHLPIGGGANWPTDQRAQQSLTDSWAAQTGLSVDRCTTLGLRYGSYGRVIAKACAKSDRGEPDQPLQTATSYSKAEIRHLILQERTTRLSDLILRRTQIGLSGQCSRATIIELAEIMADALSWTSDRKEREMASCCDLLRRRHGVSNV
jgi:glycerol-3-phosphate dehydrogenase